MRRCAKIKMSGLLLVACFVFASCASSSNNAPVEKQDQDLEFKPIQLRWYALSQEAEEFAAKDMCVIQITAKLMQDSLVLQSRFDDLAYAVEFRVDGETLVFDGIEANKERSRTPEYRWTSTCGKDGKVVVKFHNGQ